MNQAVLVWTACTVLSSSWLENVDAQLGNGPDSWSILQAFETLNDIVGNLQTEMKLQTTVLMQMQETSFKNMETSVKNLEAKAAMHDNSLSNLQSTVDELKTLLINSNVREHKQAASLSNLEAQSNMQTVLLNKVGETLENQSSLLDNFLAKEERHANNLTNMETNVASVCDGSKTATDLQNSSTTRGIVEGIIAGTSNGVVIIPFDSLDSRTISSGHTLGVAFNWQSRKVYWTEHLVGIKIANLNGSSVELLVADTSYLRGLAVDQITGNFYYGKRGSNSEIRVCDSMGKKCATVASGFNIVGNQIWDIALFPSQGLMFWSSPYDKNSVTRANLDGTNATVIALENIHGLYLDEFNERLYWANWNGKSIGHRDLNGYNRNVLLNTTFYPRSIAVDGDTLYFGKYSPNGIYSVNNNQEVSYVAKTEGEVNNIAFYGGSKKNSRPNPCQNSPCENLCVLTRASYTCL